MAIQVSNRRIVSGDHSQFANLVESKLAGLEAIFEIESGPFGIAQGYTYLGQFLAHEIAPRANVNSRSRQLDLDSLYPEFDDAEKIDSSNGKFFTQPETEDKLEDLIRDSENKALIPDFRNDDQLILAQLHLLWLNFHNHLINLFDIHCTPDPDGPLARYEEARRFTVACFQRIIVDDYMDTLTDCNVRSLLWGGDKIDILKIPHEDQLPFEFTHAAGRFGHPQVRSAYILNSDDPRQVSLEDLFLLTGANEDYEGVPNRFRIEWQLFFPKTDNDKREEAQKIKPFITPALRQRVLVKNFQAGIKKKLPSGQLLAKTIINEFHKQEFYDHGVQENIVEIDDNQAARNALEAMNLLEDTPIWLFILLESDASPTRGEKLGPLGSVLLIETIKNGLNNTGYGEYEKVQKQFEICGFPVIRKMSDLIDVLEP